jgi:hypothetical protein
VKNSNRLDRMRRFRTLTENFVKLDPKAQDFIIQFKLVRDAAKLALRQDHNESNANPRNMSIARTFANVQRRQHSKAMRDSYMPHIEALMKEGKKSMRAIAAGLNERGVKPQLAEKWTHSMVRTLLVNQGRYP